MESQMILRKMYFLVRYFLGPNECAWTAAAADSPFSLPSISIKEMES